MIKHKHDDSWLSPEKDGVSKQLYNNIPKIKLLLNDVTAILSNCNKLDTHQNQSDNRIKESISYSESLYSSCYNQCNLESQWFHYTKHLMKSPEILQNIRSKLFFNSMFITHVFFPDVSPNKTLGTKLALVGLLISRSMSQKVFSPIAGELKRLLFVADLANNNEFHVWVSEFLNILQAGIWCYWTFAFLSRWCGLLNIQNIMNKLNNDLLVTFWFKTWKIQRTIQNIKYTVPVSHTHNWWWAVK